ncbi:hypothetical protein Taro_002266 [Colocasia esculenta]|uniref:CCHC-type domain-containing protein n=1 Tax=Colocasia esculenta TaxID=4460 RepID=A0A843TGR6_COLES|nr:hypothetical protein [Colocasia esculenta]
MLTFTSQICCDFISGNASGIVALGLGKRPPTASSGVLQRLERALNIRERLPHTGVQGRSTQNPDRESFEDSLAQAEEGFSDLNRADISTSSEEIVRDDSVRECGVPAREGEQRRDEPRREDQGEQQAPAPQGPVLPPPPPVDYGVFMQGLVQAMQTQAHTLPALQAQLEAQQAQAQVPVPQAQDHGGPSIMERFKRMSPPSFKGESDPLLAESWMREIEKIFWAIRCAEDDKVTLATYMLQERADVWWSSLLRTRFKDGAVEIGWDEFEGEMEWYLEEKKASQKRPAAPFQRQERKKAAFQSPQRPVASGSSQVPSQRSPSGQKECPHCGRAHGGTECWKLVGKCLKCGSSEHRIKDCPRL